MNWTTYALKEFVSALIGVALTLLATYLVRIFKEQKRKKKLGKLEGWWIERIEKQNDRPISLAEFVYDRKQSSFEYIGSNYEVNDGVVALNYSWKTVKLFHDEINNQIQYIYGPQNIEDQDKLKEGFGVSNYDNSGDKPRFTDGHFFDLNLKSGERRKVKFLSLESALEAMPNYKLVDYSQDELLKFVQALLDFEAKNGALF